MSKITIDSQRRIALPQQVARSIGSRPLELVSQSTHHLFFAVPGEEQSVAMTGQLGDLAVADLLSFFNMFRKTGILRFSLLGGSKDLYFQQGEVVFATSTFPEEDIGEVLLGLGKIDRPTLQKARQLIPEQAGIGKVMVSKGFINPKDLWLATRNQVEHIVYHLFGFHQGSFAFIQQDLEKEEIARLSMSTQNLIMEGLRRADERQLFLRRIGSLDALPIPTGKGSEGLATEEARLFSLLGEQGPDARTAMARSGLGEFEGLRLLFQLLEKGMVRMEQPPPVPVAGEMGEILHVFNGALVILFRRIIREKADFAEQIRYFLRDLPQPYSYVFRDVVVRADGSVDGARIIANLAGLEEGEKKRLLVDALNELIFMECLVAREELGAKESAELTSRVQEISRRVKTLIGRTE